MLNWELIAVPEDDRVAAWGGWPVNCPEPPPQSSSSPPAQCQRRPGGDWISSVMCLLPHQ